MIYNMLTLSIQLLFIGFLVGVAMYFLFPKNRSQVFLVELSLSILGSFLGTIFEVLVRLIWVLPIVYYLIYQFLFPLVLSIVFVVFYRYTNSFKE